MDPMQQIVCFCDLSVREKTWRTASQAIERMHNTLSHINKTYGIGSTAHTWAAAVASTSVKLCVSRDTSSASSATCAVAADNAVCAVCMPLLAVRNCNSNAAVAATCRFSVSAASRAARCATAWCSARACTSSICRQAQAGKLNKSQPHAQPHHHTGTNRLMPQSGERAYATAGKGMAKLQAGNTAVSINLLEKSGQPHRGVNTCPLIRNLAQHSTA